jgi:hypothetical protein
MFFAQLLLANDDTYDDDNLLVRKANTMMKDMEGPSENIKEGVVKINREKTKQFVTEAFPYFSSVVRQMSGYN